MPKYHILASCDHQLCSTKMICHVWMDPNVTSYLHTIIFPICSILYLVSPHLVSKIEQTDAQFLGKLIMGRRSSLCHSKPYRILQMHMGPFFDIYNTSFTKAISPRHLWNYTFEIITCDTRDHWEINIALIKKKSYRGHLEVSVRLWMPQTAPF